MTEENCLNLVDLSLVAPEVQLTLKRLQNIVKERDEILSSPTLDEETKGYKVGPLKIEALLFSLKLNHHNFHLSISIQIEYLNYDGCPIADLGLYFTLPGHANIELRRGGRDVPVTIQNLHQYISLVTHWFLVEGVEKQFESIREGKIKHILDAQTYL